MEKVSFVKSIIFQLLILIIVHNIFGFFIEIHEFMQILPSFGYKKFRKIEPYFD